MPLIIRLNQQKPLYPQAISKRQKIRNVVRSAYRLMRVRLYSDIGVTANAHPKPCVRKHMTQLVSVTEMHRIHGLDAIIPADQHRL